MSDMTLNPRLVVTGAMGFIGSRLALHAHRSGLDILAAGRIGGPSEAERAEELKAAGVRLAIGTLQDVDYLRAVLSNRECVIHLAAAQHESHMPASYFHEINRSEERRVGKSVDLGGRGIIKK